MSRRSARSIVVMATGVALALLLGACGSEEEGPPPTLGGATVVERPDGTTP